MLFLVVKLIEQGTQVPFSAHQNLFERHLITKSKKNKKAKGLSYCLKKPIKIDQILCSKINSNHDQVQVLGLLLFSIAFSKDTQIHIQDHILRLDQQDHAQLHEQVHVHYHMKLHEDELVPACGDQDNYNIQKIRGIVNIT